MAQQLDPRTTEGARGIVNRGARPFIDAEVNVDVRWSCVRNGVPLRCPSPIAKKMVRANGDNDVRQVARGGHAVRCPKDQLAEILGQRCAGVYLPLFATQCGLEARRVGLEGSSR